MAEKVKVILATIRGEVDRFTVMVEGDETPHELAAIIRLGIEEKRETENEEIKWPCSATS
jgi:hypothetical protein